MRQKGKGRKRNGRQLRKMSAPAPKPAKSEIGITIGTAPGEVLVQFDRSLESIRFNVAQAYQFALAVTNAAEKANREFQDRMKAIETAVGGPEALEELRERARRGAAPDEGPDVEGSVPADGVEIVEEGVESCKNDGSHGSSESSPS